MSSANSYQDQVQGCLDFLRSAGFQDVYDSLLDALYHRGDLGPRSEEGTSSPAPLSEGQAPAESVISPRSLNALAAGLEQRGSRADPGSHLYGYADLGILVPEEPTYPPRSLSPQQVPWEEGLNEYDTPEDVGYERRDVIGQRHFIELELDLASDAPDTGSLSQQQYSQGARTTTTYSQGARTNTTTTSQGGMSRAGDDSEDHDSSCGSSISGAVIDLMPTSNSGACAQGASPGTCSPSGASSSKPRALDDLVWDMGPVGIRIAEPVTTPTKSNSVVNADEPKPVLSRVESLSSSFKDFDIERNDDELPSRRTSGVQLVGPSSLSSSGAVQTPVDSIDFNLAPTTSASAPTDAEVEFIPTTATTSPQLVVEQEEEVSTCVLDVPNVAEVAEVAVTPAAATSGTIASTSQAGADTQVADDSVTLQAPALPPPLRLLPQASQQSLDGSCAHKDDDVRENMGGGFSFPVTPTVPGAPPDHRIFKSWPSVRSSCTSEVIAASDDDHVAADYADDEYLRSKPSSRSASQNLGDKQFSTRPSLNEEESSSKQGEFEGWSFAKAMQPAVSAGGHAVDGSREPSLDAAPAPDGMQATSASCISEPSTSANYLTCMPPNLLHMATGTSPSAGAATSGTQSAGNTRTPSAGTSQQADTATGSTPATSPHPPHSKSPKSPPSPKAAHTPKAQQLQLKPSCSSSGQDTEHRVSGTAILPMLEMSADGRASQVSSHPATPDSQPPSPRAATTPASQAVATAASTAADTEDQFHEALSGSDEDEAHVHDEGLHYEADDELALEAAGALAWEELQVHQSSHLSGHSHSRMMEQLSNVGERHYAWDPDYLHQRYDILELRVFHRRHRTGFEETKDLPIHKDDLIAGRYQVTNFLGSAAFSRAVEAIDIQTHKHVCLKIIKNNKDYFDQSLDEIKLLRYVNNYDPDDKWGIVRLEDYFYYKEHLFLVCELLRANLYEYQKHRRDTGQDNYFTNARIQSIARQVLRALYFIHNLNLIHSDLKPENILIKSFTGCTVKVIDLGSSCYVTDQLSSYVQSRSYRAPEVILGLPYDQKIDIWSLGCILAELSSGQVLFQNDSLSTLLARLEGILGPVPQSMLDKGRYANRYYTRRGQLFEKSPHTGRYELLVPKKTSLRHRVPDADEGMLSFISYLLHIDPEKRPTAAEALQHPWLSVRYDVDFDDAASY